MSATRRGSRILALPATEGEIEAERSTTEQHVLQELRVWTENRQPDDDRQRAPAPTPVFPNAADQQNQRERKQRADVELSVVPRRDERGNRPAHHVRDAAEQARKKVQSPASQEQIGEEPGEEDVDHERPRHCDVGRQHRSEKERWIEDVAVHCGDVRQSTEEVWIPRWNPLPRFQRNGREVTNRKAADELVADRRDEKLSRKRRIRRGRACRGGRR